MDPSKDEIIVGHRLAELLRQQGRLYEAEAVRAVKKEFGMAFLQRSRGGGWKIARGVNRVFSEITPGFVWSTREKLWRIRRPSDSKN